MFEFGLTQPVDAGGVRRGDVFGFRPIAEFFADQLAPDLTARAWDARWITLLCWCLGATHDRMATPEYEWLRPLELIWIAASVRLGGNQEGRQLPGIRKVSKNFDSPPNFGITPQRLEAYRFVGPYGVYRAPMQALGLTTRDGWRLNEKGYGGTLAALVDKKIGDRFVRQQIVGQARPESYWSNQLKSIWKNPSPAVKRLLPTQWDIRSQLPKKEFDSSPVLSILEPWNECQAASSNSASA